MILAARGLAAFFCPVVCRLVFVKVPLLDYKKPESFFEACYFEPSLQVSDFRRLLGNFAGDLAECVYFLF